MYGLVRFVDHFVDHDVQQRVWVLSVQEMDVIAQTVYTNVAWTPSVRRVAEMYS